MRTTELVLIVLVMLGCIFKILHWPGAAVMLVVGAAGLALLYFPFGWRTLPSPKPMDHVLWMTLLGGAAACTAVSGVLAFLQHWPHSADLMIAGAFGCAAVVPVALVLRSKHPRLNIYLDGLLIRCVVLGGLAFTLWELFAGKPH
ncbi:MAG: GldL-related protein [Flavobacteriales bacterium]